MSTKSILKAARDRIIAGWLQGDMCARVGGKCAFCMAGAVRAAGKGNGGYAKPIKVLASAIDPKWNMYGEDVSYAQGIVIAYNDSDTRTKKQVLNKFDKAIASL